MESRYVCDFCDENCHQQNALDEHKKNCFYSCDMCNEKIKSNDASYHLYLCGNKTNKCPKCKQYIRRGIYHYHVDNNCTNPDDDDEEEEDYLSVDKRNNLPIEDKDDDCIPCENCNKAIKFSHYDFHSRHCSQNQHEFNIPKSIIDCSTNEQKTNARSTASGTVNNNTMTSPTKEKSNLINTSFQRLHLNSNRTSMKSSINDRPVSKESAISLLHEKTTQAQDTLSKDCFPNELDYVTEKLQFNIILAGSPRVGKSQLINALCGGQDLAQTSSSLNSCTKDIKCYTLEDNQQRTPGVKPFQIHFYDTPGIESWTHEGGQKITMKLIEDKKPICFIYCASPGSFADIKQLRPILELCNKTQIFCALVCTNMWANANRKEVIQEFEKELAFFGERIEKLFDQGNGRNPHKVIHFGHGALCTMVNSIEYYDEDLYSGQLPVQGIDELIHCIMEELDPDKLIGWCYAVLCRRNFWEKISQKINGFFSTKLSNIYNMFNKY